MKASLENTPKCTIIVADKTQSLFYFARFVVEAISLKHMQIVCKIPMRTDTCPVQNFLGPTMQLLHVKRAL